MVRCGGEEEGPKDPRRVKLPNERKSDRDVKYDDQSIQSLLNE